VSLQAILLSIHAAGEAEVREIETRAQDQVRGIMAQAETEAQQLREEGLSIYVIRAARERARLIYQARLEAIKIVGEAREGLVNAALERTRDQLAVIHADPIYPAVLRLLIEEALGEFKESVEAVKNVELEANPRDKSLLESILLEMKLDLPVAYKLDCWGGVIAKSEDGRVIAINTLEARLERATPYLSRSMDALFQGGFRIEPLANPLNRNQDISCDRS
jgi:V/A-type H+-transporting ATPase subunit E